MTFFPFFHRFDDKSALIIGGGKIALRRAKALAPTGIKLTLIAPQLLPALRELLDEHQGEYHARDFAADDINKSYAFVIAATDNREVNAEACELAKAQQIPVNVVDNQTVCDFIFPSLVERSPLTIAISNSGSSPVLSRLLKQQIESYVPAAYGDLSRFVGQHRQHVNQHITDAHQRSEFWQNVLQGPIAETVFSGKYEAAEQQLLSALDDRAAFNSRGEVYLIGAGPGDPDLLTLRAFRLLQQAEVVLHDRLVSDEIMALIPESVERVYVGKRRDQHSVPQPGINQLLVDYAKQGKRVARLKGGDPFVFGRGGEEIETLVDEEIPFQVVPGITAANGCSAYAGIPLTHRDYAQSVQFVTGQLKDGTIDLNWQELVMPGKTLVFYMGLRSLPMICTHLMEAGMAADTPVALVEKGTTQSQRVLVSTLDQLAERLAQEDVSSPSLFIVGGVVKLADKLKWF